MPQIRSEAQLLRAHAVSPMGPDAHADKASDDAPMADIVCLSKMTSATLR